MPITLYGTEAQKQKYVPKLASGEWFGLLPY
jgi:alkylation response protein AidB-like acyl-CoA dehydrogenase